jgi:hypothetical protein
MESNSSTFWQSVEGGRVPRFGVVVVSVVAIMALAACGPSTPAPTPTGDPSATSGASTSPSTDGGATTALDAYRGMWKAYIEALRIPDPAYPDLFRYAQGNALEVFVNGLTSAKNQGLVGEGDVVLNPHEVEVQPVSTPGSVGIEDCVDTSQSHLVKRDGSPYEDTPGGKRFARATAVQVEDGTWKVSEFGLFAVGSC